MYELFQNGTESTGWLILAALGRKLLPTGHKGHTVKEEKANWLRIILMVAYVIPIM